MHSATPLTGSISKADSPVVRWFISQALDHLGFSFKSYFVEGGIGQLHLQDIDHFSSCGEK
jgi:hypothetical protein